MTTVVTFAEAAEQVKAHLNIVEVVNRSVPLKKRGRNYLGLCPFHNERTPSFNVHPEKNLFKCFGCGEAGDALTFLMKTENKTYGEVIAQQAEALGLAITQGREDAAHAQARKTDRELLLALYQSALGFYQSQLQGPKGSFCRHYLEERGFLPNLSQRYQLGLAPSPEDGAWDYLTSYLLSAHPQLGEKLTQTPDYLEQTGLALPKKSGSGFYDRFRNRLMIPIFNPQGQVIAFGGRALLAEDNPKYLNSPETPLYNKSQTLYGLNWAKVAIGKKRRALIMEGYFDVMATQLAGLEEAVATCGTALTEEHARLLLKAGAQTLFLVFDSDKAGQQAALSALQRLEGLMSKPLALGGVSGSLSVRVLQLPSGKDPDDYFKNHTQEDFEALLETAPDGYTFKCEMALAGLPLETSQQRIEAAHRLTPLLAGIGQPLWQAELTRRYAQKLGLEQTALEQEIKQFVAAQPVANTQPKPAHSGYSASVTNRNVTTPVSGAPYPVQDAYSYQKDPQRPANKAKSDKLAAIDGPRLSERLPLRNQANLLAVETALLAVPLTLDSLVYALPDWPQLLSLTLNLPEAEPAFSPETQALKASLLATVSHLALEKPMSALITANLNPTDALFKPLYSLLADAERQREEAGLAALPAVQQLQWALRQAKQVRQKLAQLNRQQMLKTLNQQVQQLEKHPPDFSADASSLTTNSPTAAMLAVQYEVWEQLKVSPPPLSKQFPQTGGTEVTSKEIL